MSWVKASDRPLAATGNLVFWQNRGTGRNLDELFGRGQAFDKDALTGLLEGVRGYQGRHSNLNRTYTGPDYLRKGRGRSLEETTYIGGGRKATPGTGPHSGGPGTKTYTTRYSRARRSSAGSNPDQYGDGKVPSSAPSLENTKFLRNSFLATTGYNPMGNRTHGARALDRYSRGERTSKGASAVGHHTHSSASHGGHGGHPGAHHLGTHPHGATGGLHGHHGGQHHNRADLGTTQNLPGRGGGAEANGGAAAGGRVNIGRGNIGHTGNVVQDDIDDDTKDAKLPGQGVSRPRAFGAEDANPGYRAQMEDAWLVRDNFGGDPHWSYYGCYDGHGGRQVVDYTVANLHEIFAQELRATNFVRDTNGVRGIFERSFQTIDNQLRQLGAWHCGTTCTVGLIYTPSSSSTATPNRTLYIGNVGDSRASMVNAVAGGERLTVDHKASDPSEHARVTHEGGVISRGRVGGQLMLTRALGDFAFKSSGVICKPYFASREMKPDDVCVVLASDGLWDVMDEEDVARIVLTGKPIGGRGGKNLDVKRIPQNLVDIAKARGSADNITACVVFL